MKREKYWVEVKKKKRKRENKNIYLILLFGTLQSSWLTDEEFGMGHMESKPAASPAKAPPGYLLGSSRFLLVVNQLMV